LIISTGKEKAIEKIQYYFMIKALRKLRIQGMYLNVVKAIYDKPTVNIIYNGEKLKQFPLKIKNKTKVSAVKLLFNIVMEFLAIAMRQEEKIKIGKETVKISLLADDMILYLKVPKNYPRTLKTP
jgi:hypothetical protein